MEEPHPPAFPLMIVCWQPTLAQISIPVGSRVPKIAFCTGPLFPGLKLFFVMSSGIEPQKELIQTFHLSITFQARILSCEIDGKFYQREYGFLHHWLSLMCQWASFDWRVSSGAYNSYKWQHFSQQPQLYLPSLCEWELRRFPACSPYPMIKVCTFFNNQISPPDSSG